MFPAHDSDTVRTFWLESDSDPVCKREKRSLYSDAVQYFFRCQNVRTWSRYPRVA